MAYSLQKATIPAPSLANVLERPLQRCVQRLHLGLERSKRHARVGTARDEEGGDALDGETSLRALDEQAAQRPCVLALVMRLPDLGRDGGDGGAVRAVPC